MLRFNVTIATLLALMVSLVAVSDSWGQAITNLEIYQDLLENPTYTPPAGRGEFAGDGNGNLVFPPPYENPNWNGVIDEGDRRLPDDTYTLSLADGRTFTFNGSLTIQETAYEEVGFDPTTGLGRILVDGDLGEMVTLSAAVNNWVGIRILTDPSDDQEEVWETRMQSGNFINYCNILNVNQDNVGNPLPRLGAIVVGNALIDDAQAYVKSCHFESNAGYTAFVAQDGGLYWFRDNVVLGICNMAAVYCINPLSEGEDRGFLDYVVSNNHLFNVVHNTVWVSGGWNGTISNNIIENAIDEFPPDFGILVEESPLTVIANNTINDCGSGIDVDGEDDWCTVYNNIVTNCTVGIDGTGDAGDLFDYCFLWNNQTQRQGAFLGDGNIVHDPVDDSPDFVDDNPADYHLLWTSAAIDAGAPAVDDPDGSVSDMGAYGGTLANQFSMYDGYVPDYILMPGPGPYQWNNPEENEVLTFHEYWRVDGPIEIEGYHVVIEPGTKFEFTDGDFFMTTSFSIEVGDTLGAPVVFCAAPGESWSGIYVEYNEDEVYFFNCEIRDAINPGLTLLEPIGGWIAGCDIHHNEAGVLATFGDLMLGSSLEDLDEQPSNLIHDNDEYGVCIESCNLFDVYVWGNRMYSTGENEEDLTHCGLQLIASNPVFSTTRGEGGLNNIW